MQVPADVLLAQRVFRVLLSCFSFPGKVYALKDEERFLMKELFGEESVPLAVAHTLLDSAVCFCVLGKEKERLQRPIYELTKSPVCSPEEAQYMFFSGGEKATDLLRLKRGSIYYPEDSATLVWIVEFLSEESSVGVGLGLRGPGINGERKVFIGGVEKDLLETLKEINSNFPVGIDCFFIDKEGKLMGIPRSVSLEVL
ncbi:phosphonate C-P lyase system protein PhnH [Thermocrinis sp.]